MSRLGRRPRRAAALVAVLALVTAPVLVTAPAQAEVDPCTPYLQFFRATSPLHVEVLLDGTWPTSWPTTHEWESVIGYPVSPCEGYDWFDKDTPIKEMHGSVTLADGTTDRNLDFDINIEIDHFDPDGNNHWFRVNKSFDKDRYRQLSVLGRATLTAWASDGIHPWISGSTNFYIRRPVAFFAFNASPEPVRKGSPLKLTGTLKRVGFYKSGEPTWVPIAGKRVDLLFSRAGVGEYYQYASTTTSSTGTFTKTVTATSDGYWKPYSRETDRWARRWSGREDYVDVR